MFGGEQEEEPFEEPPPPLPPPIPPPIEEPEEDEEPEEPGIFDDRVTIYDDFGNLIGTYTEQEWLDITLLTNEEFREQFGFDFNRVTLIHLIEEYLDIEWDWDAFKSEYEARNG